jgi:predicted phage-related endonuclease
MLTPQQLEERRKYICSSDAAAIVLGDDGYGRTPSDVWMEKTGKVDDLKTTKAMDTGNRLEPVLVKYAADYLNRPVLVNVMRVASNGLMAANYDAIEQTDNDLPPSFHIEAKTTGITDEWGEPGTDDVPYRTIIQVHVGFVVTSSLEIAHVPVLMPGFKSLDWRLYHVPRIGELCEAIEEKCCVFMEKHVKRDIPPEDFAPSLEILKRAKRTTGKEIELVDGLGYLQALERAQANAKAADEQVDEAKRQILQALGDAEVAKLPDGRCFTNFLQQRAEFVSKPISFRVLRVKAAPKVKAKK